MALVVKDRVKETTTSTGTGTITLGGASPGFQSFAVIGNGNVTYYVITDQQTGDWEVGIGTYTSSGTTLSRTTVLESSNAGSLVSFSAGSKDVFVTYPAERSVYLDTAGSAVTLLDIGTAGIGTANISTANITAGTVSTTPTGDNDLANKAYVDSIAVQSVHYHAPVKYEVPDTTGNLNATYNNGSSGVGATLTNAGTLVAFTPDGIVASVNDRILIYNQTNAAQNGVYTVTTVGSGSVAWVLTRATDADTYDPISPTALGGGDAFFVTSGNTGAGETYVCNNTGTITFGTTAITFVQVSATQVYSAGTGLTLTGTQFSITPVGTASTYGSASQVPVFTTNASGQVSSVTNTAIAITAGAVSGLASSATTDTTNAANISSGTLPSARLSGSYTGVTGVGTLTAGTWNASTVAASYGGTGQTTYAVGDILYASTTSALSKLADVATGNALISGGVGTAPSWGKVGLTTHVSGTLPVASGGTGATTLTGYVYGNGTGAFTASASIPNSATTATSANTASAIVARDASGNFSAGTITATLSGNASTATSATSATTATNLAGGVAGAVPYQSGSGATAFSAAGTSGQVLTSAGTASPTWTTPATVNDGTLTMNVSGTGLSGSQTFTANQSSAATFTVTSNATNANTASTIVARDASGNFSAGTITAALSGNATTATTLATGRTIQTNLASTSSASFNGSANITPGVTGTLPLANGGTGATTGAGAFGNINGYTTTATAAGTTTLTSSSTRYQVFTGTTTQTITLPVTSTLVTGWEFKIVNNSTGNLTVNSSGANLVATIIPGMTIVFTCINTGVTTAAGWEVDQTGTDTYTGTGSNVLSVSPVLTTPNIGSATGSISGNAGTATTLQTARTIQTNLASTSSASFNGSANITPGVTGTLPVANGGTGAATLTANNVLLGNGTSALQAVAPSTSGNILTSNGTTWVSSAPGGGFAAGTLMMFVQTAAPTGWTKSTTHNDKALRVVSGTASSGGSVAFTTAFASGLSAGATTLNTTQIPSHNHSNGANADGSQGLCGGRVGTSASTGSTGGGGSHNHTLPSFAVQYVDVIIASKD